MEGETSACDVRPLISSCRRGSSTGTSIGERGRLFRLNPVVAPELMDQALTEIGRRYPNIRWNESGAGFVRVTDSAARTGLLQVRIPEFILLDDRGRADAQAAIWKTPEVQAFVKKTGMRIVPPARRTQNRGRCGRSS